MAHVMSDGPATQTLPSPGTPLGWQSSLIMSPSSRQPFGCVGAPTGAPHDPLGQSASVRHAMLVSTAQTSHGHLSPVYPAARHAGLAADNVIAWAPSSVLGSASASVPSNE